MAKMDTFHRWEAPLTIMTLSAGYWSHKKGLQSQFMSLWRTFHCKWSKGDNTISVISETSASEEVIFFFLFLRKNTPKPSPLRPRYAIVYSECQSVEV